MVYKRANGSGVRMLAGGEGAPVRQQAWKRKGCTRQDKNFHFCQGKGGGEEQRGWFCNVVEGEVA